MSVGPPICMTFTHWTVQEKYGQPASSTRLSGVSARSVDEEEESGSSSDSEEEDDDGVLASEALDAQIQETLDAIRKKDPRVYDKNMTFYSSLEGEVVAKSDPKPKEAKPMYLNDYHRTNLIGEKTHSPERSVPATYADQQEDLKNRLVKEMHAAAIDQIKRGASDEEGEEDDFLVTKSSFDGNGGSKAHRNRDFGELDVGNADNDPEAYLSKFMSARAWVPSQGSRFQPFESDDDEEDRRADEFEEAYNLRFEDPAKSNEKLMSHARDAAAKYSVRVESLNPRKRARETDRSKKEAAKILREEEKSRFRKLKVAEAEEKIQRIKEAAGLHGESLNEGDWSVFLEEGWDDTRWEAEMKKRFGDNYYADRDADSGQANGNRQKLRKPKWDDDIEINDLVPDFEAGDATEARFELSDDDQAEVGASLENGDAHLKKRDRKEAREQHKKETRQERRKIERLVDEQMNVQETLSNFGKKHAGQFRYRETSPLTFGLTSQDILMASDSQLNEYAGLKKIAAFRDTDKKKKDRKHLGKKGRLRQWRKDIFGDENGPKQTFAEVFTGEQFDGKRMRPKDPGREHDNLRRGKSRKKRASKGNTIDSVVLSQHRN